MHFRKWWKKTKTFLIFPKMYFCTFVSMRLIQLNHGRCCIQGSRVILARKRETQNDVPREWVVKEASLYEWNVMHICNLTVLVMKGRVFIVSDTSFLSSIVAIVTHRNHKATLTITIYLWFVTMLTTYPFSVVVPSCRFWHQELNCILISLPVFDSPHNGIASRRHKRFPNCQALWVEVD